MNLAIIRGENLNPWDIQSFEPLAGEFNVVACGSTDGPQIVGGSKLAIRRFRQRAARMQSFGRIGRLGCKLGLWRMPPDELIGLEDFLVGMDVAHAAEFHIPYSEQAIRAKLEHGVRVVLTCWETIPYAYEEDADIRARRAFVRKNVDLCLPTTERAAAALRTEGVENERIRLVRPGVDLERFSPGDPTEKMRKMLGVTKAEIVFLFVGRLIGEKGVRELVVAFSQMLERVRPSISSRCRLLIAGQGPLQEFAEALILVRGIGDKAKIVGSIAYSEMHDLHRISDVFVLPSISAPYWEEQVGMVLVEAMACGKAVLSTRTGGISEVVGEAGLLVPALDVEALAQRMAELAAEEQFRRHLGTLGRAGALQRFDARKTAAQLAAVYTSLIGQSCEAGAL